MTVDIIAPPFSLNSDPIKGLEIKALEKTNSPYEYRITDKDVISALENVTERTIKKAYIVDCGETEEEEEWVIIAFIDIPPEFLLYEDDSCVFDISRMEGNPADLL